MTFIVLLIFLLLFLFLRTIINQNRDYSKIKGQKGEKQVQKYLSKLDPKDYCILNDITLKTEQGKTTQIDHIVISKSGVFVIETKNYEGWIFGSEKESKWKQVIFKRKEQFHNPIWQNYGHIKALEYLINNKDVPFISIIAFSRSSTLKKIELVSKDVYVVYSDELLNYIPRYDKPVLSSKRMMGIYNLIQKENIKDKKIQKQHVQNIRAKRKEENIKIQNYICPRCNSKLVQRSSSKGDFLGCSKFPSCRFTA